MNLSYFQITLSHKILQNRVQSQKTDYNKQVFVQVIKNQALARMGL